MHNNQSISKVIAATKVTQNEVANLMKRYSFFIN
jgi:hypothetical protein